MAKQARAKQERIIEAVRQGIDGDEAIEFVRQSGYAMTPTGIARHLRHMGGRGRILELIEEGKTNIQILEICFPDDELEEVKKLVPSQGELFSEEAAPRRIDASVVANRPLYETYRLSLRLPADLYEAIRFAAKAEGKSQNQLIVEILTTALSQAPRHIDD